MTAAKPQPEVQISDWFKLYGEKWGSVGGEQEIKTERKSFFRTLCERKGSPRIDFETVLCFERV